MTERRAVVTPADIAFVRQAVTDYRLFAEALERTDEPRAAGQMRAQQFYAERFLGRLLAGPSTEEGA